MLSLTQEYFQGFKDGRNTTTPSYKRIVTLSGNWAATAACFATSRFSADAISSFALAWVRACASSPESQFSNWTDFWLFIRLDTANDHDLSRSYISGKKSVTLLYYIIVCIHTRPYARMHTSFAHTHRHTYTFYYSWHAMLTGWPNDRLIYPYIKRLSWCYQNRAKINNNETTNTSRQ